MEELPTTLSPEVAAAVVVLVRGARADAAGGFAVAAVVAAAAWLASARWLPAAIAACVAFPVAARLVRAARLRRLRQRFVRHPDEAAQRAAAAWREASPGQRAALQMLVKKSA